MKRLISWLKSQFKPKPTIREVIERVETRWEEERGKICARCNHLGEDHSRLGDCFYVYPIERRVCQCPKFQE